MLLRFNTRDGARRTESRTEYANMMRKTAHNVHYMLSAFLHVSELISQKQIYRGGSSSAPSVRGSTTSSGSEDVLATAPAATPVSA